MDLFGKAVKMDSGWLYTETIEGNNMNEKNIVVKGVISKKILFDKRPCPNMERAELEPKLQMTNNLFKNLEIRNDMT